MNTFPPEICFVFYRLLVCIIVTYIFWQKKIVDLISLTGCCGTGSTVVENFGPFIEYIYSYSVKQRAEIGAESYKVESFIMFDAIDLPCGIVCFRITETVYLK